MYIKRRNTGIINLWISLANVHSYSILKIMYRVGNGQSERTKNDNEGEMCLEIAYLNTAI